MDAAKLVVELVERLELDENEQRELCRVSGVAYNDYLELIKKKESLVLKS